MSLVLIADDEAALLETMADLAQELGHRVVTARDGVEALARAREEHPDVLVVDHMMPHMKGIAVIHALREDPAFAGTPMILVSAGHPRGAEAAWRFVEKPMTLAQFRDVLEEAVARTAGATASSASASTSASGASAERDALSAEALTSLREDMVNWVAHEFKTPLSAAKLSAEMLARKLERSGDEADRRRLRVILRQHARMGELVDSILEAARLEEGRTRLELSPIDLRALLVEAVDYWRELHPELTITLTAPPACTVAGDAERLRTIFDNLLSNACKYGRPVPAIEVELAEDGGDVVVRVTDHGQGIDPVQVPRIFERFHRVSGAGGNGHGLGLYVAMALARLHGGTIDVRSQPGQGSTFTLRLPCQEKR